MPIYEYICNACKKTFSLIQKIGASEKDTVCPQCGATDSKKKFSVFSSSTSKNIAESSPAVPSFGGGG